MWVAHYKCCNHRRAVGQNCIIPRDCLSQWRMPKPCNRLPVWFCSYTVWHVCLAQYDRSTICLFSHRQLSLLSVVLLKGRYNSSWGEPHLRATGRHLPYGITQCYLPPNTSECVPPNPTPAMQAGTRFTYHGGIEGWVDLVDLIVPWLAGSLTSDLSIMSLTIWLFSDSWPSLVSGRSLDVLEHSARWHSVCAISFCLS